MSVYVTTPAGTVYEIPNTQNARFVQNGELLFVHQAGNFEASIGYIRLEPGMIVNVGNEPPRRPKPQERKLD